MVTGVQTCALPISEYDAAKNEQAEVEVRINKLEDMMRHAKIIATKLFGTEYSAVSKFSCSQPYSSC